MFPKKKYSFSLCPKTGKRISRRTNHRRWLWLFPLTGLLALIWFLVRVIPKPSRAIYPCQRVAAPLASSFVVWLLGLTISTTAFHRAKRFFRRSGYIAAGICLAVGVLAVYLPLCTHSQGSTAASTYEPFDPPNYPCGVARGVYPGRVVWVHDPNATSWEGSGNLWDDEHTDPVVVEQMMADGIRDIVGAANLTDAWDRIFTYFNVTHNKGEIGYQAGEKIVVKLNMNRCVSSHDNPDWNDTLSSPQMVLALLRQLVYDAGVDDNDITFFDASRYIPDVIYDRCKAEFPDVHFVDWSGGDGRERRRPDLSCQMYWSDDLIDPTEEDGGCAAFLPSCVSHAEYLINLADLKGHSLAGITACAKNHFGSFYAGGDSIYAPKRAGIHPYVAVHDYSGGKTWEFDARPMDTYNPLVDLMGHEELGGKSLIFIINGLYANKTQSGRIGVNDKWSSTPFDGNWPSSIFVSLDGVAIDSVALDFLRSEPTIQNAENVLNAGDSVDNYLHEAALAPNSPSGTFYDPEGDGVPLTSLGVHEHWNNATDKQYTRNLGTGDGIELVKSPIVYIADGDINGGGVDFEDLTIICQKWLDENCAVANCYCAGADIDQDGYVTFLDFASFADDWYDRIGIY